MTLTPNLPESVVTELLACPFCGGTPEFRLQGNDHTRTRKLTLKCLGCRFQITNGAIRHGVEWLYEITTAAWNTRTTHKSELPELPVPGVTETRNDLSHDGDYEVGIGYTADQMRAYANGHATYWYEMWRAANARAEGLEADARRYRYLRSLKSRDHGHHTRRAFHAGQVDWAHNLNPNNIVGVCNMWGQSELSGPDLDAAIDAAQAVRSEGDSNGR